MTVMLSNTIPPNELPPAEVQRRLQNGRCVACDLRVPTARHRRRAALCPRCEADGWHWCSRGQHVAPHAAFHPLRKGKGGLGYECRPCQAARRRVPDRPCQRKGCANIAHRTQGAWHKLCAACLRRYAWCSGCGARPRTAFTGRVRDGRRHAGECRRCESDATGAQAAYRAACRERRAAVVAYAQAHPEQDARAIGVHFGIAANTVEKTLHRAGVRRGQTSKRAAAEQRWRLALRLTTAELATTLEMRPAAAQSLRARARQALAAGKLTLDEGATP